MKVMDYGFPQIEHHIKDIYLKVLGYFLIPTFIHTKNAGTYALNAM
jgi:hypothetical protein